MKLNSTVIESSPYTNNIKDNAQNFLCNSTVLLFHIVRSQYFWVEFGIANEKIHENFNKALKEF